jgi:uncharacterized protein (TIGR02145 family)
MGMLYQWNKKVGWSSKDPLINSDGGTTWKSEPAAGSTWEKANDPCPAGWHIPKMEISSIMYNEDGWITAFNGVEGVAIHIRQEDTYIFFPFSFMRGVDGRLSTGVAGGGGGTYYWFNTPYDSNGVGAGAYRLNDGRKYAKGYINNSLSKFVALPIRCVADK